MKRPFIGLSAAVLLVALLSCKALKKGFGSSADESAAVAVASSAASAPAGSAAAPTARDEWVLFSSSDARFRLRLPQQPELERQTTQTQTGPVELSLLTSTGRSGTVYQIGYSDFPEARLRQQAPGKLLAGAQQGAVTNVQGKLLSERVLEVHGHPAREYSVEVVKQGMKLSYWGRMILADTRLYQLQVIGLASQVKNAERERFFESFELLEQKK